MRNDQSQSRSDINNTIQYFSARFKNQLYDVQNQPSNPEESQRNNDQTKIRHLFSQMSALQLQISKLYSKVIQLNSQVNVWFTKRKNNQLTDLINLYQQLSSSHQQMSKQFTIKLDQKQSINSVYTQINVLFKERYELMSTLYQQMNKLCCKSQKQGMKEMSFLFLQAKEFYLQMSKQYYQLPKDCSNNQQKRNDEKLRKLYQQMSFHYKKMSTLQEEVKNLLLEIGNLYSQISGLQSSNLDNPLTKLSDLYSKFSQFFFKVIQFTNKCKNQYEKKSRLSKENLNFSPKEINHLHSFINNLNLQINRFNSLKGCLNSEIRFLKSLISNSQNLSASNGGCFCSQRSITQLKKMSKFYQQISKFSSQNCEAKEIVRKYEQMSKLYELIWRKEQEKMISFRKIKCSLCSKRTNADDFLKAFKCQHVYCKRCLKQYFQTQIKYVRLIKCPTQSCKSSLNKQCTVFKNLPQNDREAYQSIEFRKNIQNDKSLQFCPNKKCKLGYINVVKGRSTGKCVVCLMQFCLKCNVELSNCLCKKADSPKKDKPITDKLSQFLQCLRPSQCESSPKLLRCVSRIPFYFVYCIILLMYLVFCVTSFILLLCSILIISIVIGYFFFLYKCFKNDKKFVVLLIILFPIAYLIGIGMTFSSLMNQIWPTYIQVVLSGNLSLCYFINKEPER